MAEMPKGRIVVANGSNRSQKESEKVRERISKISEISGNK